jgi:integrase
LHSTGTRDRGAAEQTLAAFLVELRDPVATATLTINAIIDAWLAHKERISQRETEWRVQPVKRLVGHLRPEDWRPWHLRGYVEARRKEKAADGTIYEEMSKLRAALRWAEAEQMIAKAPIIRPSGLQRRPRTRWLTREEADALVAACKAPHVRLFAIIALNTGARSSAVLELTWERVDLARRLVDFGHKPGGKARAVVPMTDELRRALEEAVAARTTLWVIEWAGRRVNKIRDSIAKASARAGLDPPASPHDLRRTAASHLLQAGVPIEQVAAILGHAGIHTTLRVYAKLAAEHLRGAVAKLNRG